MIYHCPFCGRNISHAIRDGITTCNNCSRVFDSSPYCKILATAWAVRRNNLFDIESIQSSFELTDCEAKIIQKYVLDEDCNHEELIKIIDSKICIETN